MQRATWVLAVAATAAIALSPRPVLAGQGVFRLKVIDRDTQQPVACRMHLTNAAHRPLKAPKVPFWHDHFVFFGEVTLKLPEGEYAFEIERGLEYLVRSGHFTMQNFSDDEKVVDLKRFANMANEGWWSGDLDTARPAKDLELLMEADDLHVVELVSWPNRKALLPKSTGGKNAATKGNVVAFGDARFYHLAAGNDARAGGSLLLFNLEQPLDLSKAKAEYPPQAELLATARKQPGAWIDAQKAYSWDLPVWIATGQLDSVQLANSNLGRKTSVNNESGGRPRDARLFPGNTGNGRWTEAIYYKLLECGLRLPPTAGSGSGVVANPLGYNRMYVHVDGELTYEKWWEGVKAGRIVVTNGPLIRPDVEGEKPGHVFRAPEGSDIELEIGLTLSTRDKISYLEVIKNGDLVHQVRLADWQATGGKLPLLKFEKSGWFLIRAATDLNETYRFASTAPYYVEIGEQPRISLAAAQFFLDWVELRMKNLKLDDPEQLEAVLKWHRQAREYWQALVEKANAK